MLSNRQLFLRHVAQTSESSLQFEIERAEGIYFYDKKGKPYLDLVSGVAVSALGHGHPKVKEAVKGDDAEKIKKACDELTQCSHKLAEAIYQQAASQREKEGKKEESGAKEEKAGKEDVVDAEYKVEDEEEKKEK